MRPLMQSEIVAAKLAEEYKYQEIPPMFSGEYHDLYRRELPAFLSEEGDNAPLFDLNGVQICAKYERIVIGDYGAFVEIADADMCKANLCLQPGQEYRVSEPRYADHVKYVWWTTINGSGPKLYEQKRTVPYADYRVGYWYVSPFDVAPTK